MLLHFYKALNKYRRFKIIDRLKIDKQEIKTKWHVNHEFSMQENSKEGGSLIVRRQHKTHSSAICKYLPSQHHEEHSVSKEFKFSILKIETWASYGLRSKV